MYSTISDPGSHGRQALLPPFPTTVRASISVTKRLLPYLPSSTRVEYVVQKRVNKWLGLRMHAGNGFRVTGRKTLKDLS